MDFNSLQNKKILITGASSGIGRETAYLLSGLGCRLVINGTNEPRLSSTFESLHGEGHIQFTGDLTDEIIITKLVGISPALDGIFHCAGITSHLPTQFVKTQNIYSVFDLNYKAPVLLTSMLLKKKKINKGASILFISSVATQNPYFGGSLYISSKSALEGYSKTLALELAGKGIRSNCISPGYVKTSMTAAARETISDESMDRIENDQMLGAGEPIDVAKTIAYFLSDASKWVTGTNLILGG